MRMRWVPLALLCAVCSWKVVACSIDYYSYITYGGRSVLTMPRAVFDIECRRILNMPVPEEIESRHATSRAGLYEQSRKTDLDEFAEAVREDVKAEQMIADYSAVREAVSQHVFPWLQEMDGYYGPGEEAQRPEPFDLAPYEETLSSLPDEFERYFRGAVAYFDGDWDAAAGHFASVLELPAEQRAYRSTWAAFMLGKTWTRKDPAQAGPFFEQTRALAADGFHDSLGLAAASAGWQARADMLSRDYVAAVHGYAGLKDDACFSLRIVCSRALAEDPLDPALVQDELSRQILTAWLSSRVRESERQSGRDKAGKWLALLESAQLDGALPGADRLAWLSYQSGDMEGAARWLGHCDPEAPYARWVQAKLLLRDGRIEEGTVILRRLSDAFPGGETWRIQSPWERMWTPVSALGVVREDLAYVLFQQGDYAGSLLAFLRGGNWADAIFLAERVMTPKELRDFVEAQAQNPELEIEESEPRLGLWGRLGIVDLRYLLARRWARMGEWDKAVAYFPEGETSRGSIRGRAEEAKAHSEGAHDETLAPRARAEHLFELARLIREYGPELYCPELIPDAEIKKRFETPEFPADLGQRLDESLRPYPRMNYFRWAAADLMWQAAELLPDNDVLAAHALYLGGTYVKNKDPEGADRFYKALVRRNPNLLIAREADKLRWFPAEFTDVVLYQSRPRPHWYDRKRNLALAVSALAAVAGLAAIAVLRRKLTPKRTSPETNAQAAN